MRSSKFIYVFFALGILGSCGNKTTVVPNGNSKTDTVEIKNTNKDTIAQESTQTQTFEGILPCSKCEGINTYLVIANDNQSATMSVSHLDNAFVEEEYSYTLNTERGYEKDEDATVYILNWDKPEIEQRVFVRKTGNDSTIFEIKSNRKRFSDKKNHTLIKKDLN